MTDWVITSTLTSETDRDTAAAWEQHLDAFDAVVSRIPHRGQTLLTLHVSNDDILKATVIAHNAVQDATGTAPTAIETITEAEQEQRADEPTIPELMSAADIAEKLGISRQRVHQLRTTDTFPAPLADLRGGAVWDAAAIRHFNQNWTRKPGRPRQAS